MFRGRERLVERGHIGVGVIADVAKPVVPDLLRLADEVVFIVLAEQAVGARMLLRSIYNALDLNSHIKLFQLVSRRGFELAGDVDDCADAALVRADRDDLPLVAVTLPCDIGVLIRIQVCMLGVDKRSGVERFDILVFFKLDLVCPDAVVILPDVFAVLQNFRISGGIRHAEIHTRVILPVLNMYAVGFFALDANRTALIQRGLCGRGHFMRGFDPRVRCRFHPRLTIFIIGEVERDGLRGRGVLHLPDQIAGLLHEPCRPDSHRADISARAIAYDLADRMLCVGRESERILYRIMRSGCRNADNIYNNAGHVVFRGLGGLVGGWGVRLPNGVELGGRGGCCNPITRLDGGRCCVRFPIPAEEVVAFSGRNRAGNGERHRAGVGRFSLRVGYRHIGDCVCRVRVVVQGVGDFRVGILVDKVEILRAGIRLRAGNVRSRIYRRTRKIIENILILPLRIIRSELPACPVFCLVRIELFQFYRMVVARMLCAVGTSNSYRLDQHRILVAKRPRTVQYNLVNPYRDFVPGAVGSHRRHRQHTEHHNQN